MDGFALATLTVSLRSWLPQARWHKNGDGLVLDTVFLLSFRSTLFYFILTIYSVLRCIICTYLRSTAFRDSLVIVDVLHACYQSCSQSLLRIHIT